MDVSAQSIRTLITIRAVVAALGERTTPPWWRTQFLTEAGLRAMVRIFPRTALTSAVTCVTEVARTEHDSRIGVRGRFHLFRLPIEFEEELADGLKDSAIAGALDIALKRGAAHLLSVLDLLSVRVGITPKEGPTLLGKASRIGSERSLAEIAAHYRTAIASNTRCYPYFEELR